MQSSTPTEAKKSFFQNDRALVCSMLAFYTFCIVGLAAAGFWGWNWRSNQLAANATSTAQAIATERTAATATAVARRDEQNQYQFIDRFDSNVNQWRTGPESSEYWNGYTSVRDGIYRWEVSKTKKTFVSWADFPGNPYLKDFDVYVDTKVVKAEPGDVCSGFLFRISPSGWDEGGYYFALCNNSYVSISYHTEKDGWKAIKGIFYPVRPSEWYRLEISARGDHFTFFVNSVQVYEMDDDRQAAGGLALVVELNELTEAEVAFDNFGFQPR